MAPIERLLNMTCTLQRDRGGTGSEATWGHKPANAQVYATGVRCNLQPGVHKEHQRQYVEAAQTEVYRLYVEWREDLLAPGAEREYDVVDVVDNNGHVVHDGALDILAIGDPTGRRSHLEIICVAKALT